MGNRRTAKVAEAIREVVSSTIVAELRDPRIRNVTVLGVDVPADLRTARVRVSVMGDEVEQRLSMRGLDAARGYLQGKVAARVNLRFTPILRFELDDAVKKSAEASRILRELAEERDARATSAPVPTEAFFTPPEEAETPQPPEDRPPEDNAPSGAASPLPREGP